MDGRTSKGAIFTLPLVTTLCFKNNMWKTHHFFIYHTYISKFTFISFIMLFYFLMKKCKIIDIHYIRLTMFHISNYHNQLWVLSLVVGVPYLKVSGRPGGSGHDTESPTSSLVLYDELADVNPSHQTMTHIQDLWHCQQREKMCSSILVYYKIFWVIGVNSTSACLNSLWEIFNWCANKIHIFFF